MSAVGVRALMAFREFLNEFLSLHCSSKPILLFKKWKFDSDNGFYRG
jgi:hypothetical protein